MKTTFATIFMLALIALFTSAEAKPYDRDDTADYLSEYSVTHTGRSSFEVRARLTKEFQAAYGKRNFMASSTIHEFKASNTKNGSYIPPQRFATSTNGKCKWDGDEIVCQVYIERPERDALDRKRDTFQINVDLNGDNKINGRSDEAAIVENGWDKIIFAHDEEGNDPVDVCYDVGFWLAVCKSGENTCIHNDYKKRDISIPLHDAFDVALLFDEDEDEMDGTEDKGSKTASLSGTAAEETNNDDAEKEANADDEKVDDIASPATIEEDDLPNTSGSLLADGGGCSLIGSGATGATGMLWFLAGLLPLALRRRRAR